MRKFISIFAKFCLFLIILFEAGGFVFRTHEYIATKILMLYQPDTLYYGHGFEIGIVSGLLL